MQRCKDESVSDSMSHGTPVGQPPRKFARSEVAICDLEMASSGLVPFHLGHLTMGAQKPSLVIEQASSSYSFRFSELSQPI